MTVSHQAIIAALAGLFVAATPLIDQTTLASPAPPTTPAPAQATTPTQGAEPVTPSAAANPFDQLLASAHPYANTSHSAPAKVQTASTKDCTTNLTLDGGDKLTIDLKKMQGLSVNANLMITGGGQSVQLEFEGKTAMKDAAAADKALADLNDKCGG